MKPQELFAIWQTYAEMGRAVGISDKAVSRWFKRGQVPRDRQLFIEQFTGGRLKAEEFKEVPRGPITAENIKLFIEYDPKSGVVVRLIDSKGRPERKVMVGDKSCRYIRVSVCGREYYAHRLAFLYMTGEWPAEMVDHIDGNGRNNAFLNLRAVSNSVNQQNRNKPRASNKLERMGVYEYRGKFVAQIRYNGKQHCIGRFKSPDEAESAYLQVKRRVHEGCTI